MVGATSWGAYHDGAMMASFEYQVERGELVIFRLAGRVEVWRGSFDEGSVVKLSAMPGSDGCAVVRFW